MPAKFILTDIYIYPIKSLGGVRVEQAAVEPQGLQYDRRWMLVDESGTFLTQRVLAGMALFQVALQADGLHVTHRQQPTESIFIPFDSSQYNGNPVRVNIWDDMVTAVEVNSGANAWFSRLLQQNCRLVFMPPAVHRPVDPDYAHANEPVSFADAYPFLLIGQESLNELNTRLPAAVPMNRFRPNFVFAGGEPFIEDTWREFSIGTQHFAAVKPCARCVLTTVDQQTAEKGPEPLRTLATYRLRNNKVMFGQNILPRAVTGPVRVGDFIRVASYQSEASRF